MRDQRDGDDCTVMNNNAKYEEWASFSLPSRRFIIERIVELSGHKHLSWTGTFLKVLLCSLEINSSLSNVFIIAGQLSTPLSTL